MLLDEPNALTPDQVVAVHNEAGDHRLVLVCEHASNWIPPAYRALGLDEAARRSHAAWDPGALGVAEALNRTLNAPLVAGCVSRLVYDCNRPPEAEDAVPAVSEAFAVPGNTGLTDEARADRVEMVYRPFRQRLEQVLNDTPEDTVLVTVHSFTPIYHGRQRTTEIGILHGDDPRLAEAMMAIAGQFTRRRVRLNDPYGPEDGVAHTLNLHGSRNGLANVMIEVRNDLIDKQSRQTEMADLFAGWLRAAIARLGSEIRS
ncbi:MAG: N-formylglutamate amidohydrolase [Hyphomicrobiales bacterium]|nr:N-formylglutamate amidohydrolase [Hyphomicrobiales bacterium]MCP5002012.1 N-formylglutamate amidohydrolase [Hyphomicrobiales bacterium]